MSLSDNKKWFEKLRINSWEIEILIVACILAALFNLPDIASEKIDALAVSTHNDARSEDSDALGAATFWMIVGIVKILMYTAVQILILIAKVTFSFYIFFRGFWVAVIGLSSVFSKGIDVKNLKFSSYFNKLIPNTGFDNYILRLDNICSSVFSLGFLTAFFYISILIYLSILILFLAALEFSATYFLEIIKVGAFLDMLTNFLAVIFFVFGFIFFVDIIFLGILKRVKWKIFSYPYSKIYNFLRIVTGFFLYESIYYLFISNVKRRVIFICWLLFGLLIGYEFLSNKANQGHLKFPSTIISKSFLQEKYYEDRLLASGNNFSFTKTPFINSEIISESFLTLFIPFHPYMHSSLDSACSITSQVISDDKNMRQYDILLDCINNIYAIYIDNDTIVSDFVFYDYSGENDVSINTFFMPISVKKYQEGKHVITIEKLFPEGLYWNENLEDYVLSKEKDSLIHIPFYIYR